MFLCCFIRRWLELKKKTVVSHKKSTQSNNVLKYGKTIKPNMYHSK